MSADDKMELCFGLCLGLWVGALFVLLLTPLWGLALVMWLSSMGLGILGLRVE